MKRLNHLLVCLALFSLAGCASTESGLSNLERNVRRRVSDAGSRADSFMGRLLGGEEQSTSSSSSSSRRKKKSSSSSSSGSSGSSKPASSSGGSSGGGQAEQ